MRLEAPGRTVGDISEAAIPGCLVADAFDLLPGRRRQRVMVTAERLTNERNFIRVKAHQVSAGGVHISRVAPENDEAAGDRVRVRRAAAFAGDDAINQAQVALAPGRLCLT